MKTVQLAEAKAKFSELVRQVERGEVIDVTRNGKTVVRLTRPEVDDAERRRKAVQAVRDLKKSGRKTGITVEELLSARDEGRRPL